MGWKENDVSARFLLRASKMGARFWRNSVGSAWAGKGLTMKPGQVYKAKGGERLIIAPRQLSFGLCEGSGDFIGFVPIEITTSMVGLKLPVFASAEMKTARGRVSDAQKDWGAFLTARNAISLVVRDPEVFEFRLPSLD